MHEQGSYIGTELEMFAQAKTWKAYFAAKLRPYIHGEVLEVGAGIGATTPILLNERCSKWICLEPDASQAEIAIDSLAHAGVSHRVEVIVGAIHDLPSHRIFDSIVYVDVLEHIEHDLTEFRSAANLLKSGGTLIVLAPAYQTLFSEFDRSIGHFRRYNKRTLRRLVPPALHEESLFHLDSVGLLVSLLNRLILRQSNPTVRQILTWDRLIVPISRVVDLLLMYRVGRSVVGVWRKA